MLLNLVEGLQPVARLLIHHLILDRSQDFLVLVLRANGSDGHHEESAPLLLDGGLGFNLVDMASMALR